MRGAVPYLVLLAAWTSAIAAAGAGPEARFAEAERMYTTVAAEQAGFDIAAAEWVDAGRLLVKSVRADRDEYRVVDADTGTSRVAFDHAALASRLATALGVDVDARRLPVADLYLRQDGVELSVAGARFRCDARACVPVADRVGPPGWPAGTEMAGRPGPLRIASPDGAFEVFGQGHDLGITEVRTGASRRLSSDGAVDFAYGDGVNLAFAGNLTVLRAGGEVPPSVLWSPDSRWVLTFKTDLRQVREVSFKDNAYRDTGVDNGRTWKMRIPFGGDPDVPRVSFHLFEAASGRSVPVSLPPAYFGCDPIRADFAWWNESGTDLYLLVKSRYARKLTLFRVDPESGSATRIVEETADTFLEPAAWPNLAIRHVPASRDVIWYSQRDDYGSLYRYPDQAAVPVRLTPRGMFVSSLLHVDPASGWVYFMAGREAPGVNPLQLSPYRASLDGKRLEAIDTRAGQKRAVVSPDGRYVASISEGFGAVPELVLFDAEGGQRTVDLGDSKPPSGPLPEQFTVKARDGETELFGALFRPEDFDPAKRYPVVYYTYGGPSGQFVPGTAHSRLARYARAMNRLGLTVVFLDGMGTSGRRKSFNEVGYGSGFTDCGLPDVVGAIGELAVDRPWMDTSRIGIIGHSGGGYCALRGLLAYPEFFKVAVSSAGSHDQRLVGAGWGDSYIGPIEENPEAWAAQDNATLASRLRGKLLLAHGDLDDDVVPGNSLHVADALIREHKRFDLLLLPGENHASSNLPYMRYATWKYLVEHLAAE